MLRTLNLALYDKENMSCINFLDQKAIVSLKGSKQEHSVISKHGVPC